LNRIDKEVGAIKDRLYDSSALIDQPRKLRSKRGEKKGNELKTNTNINTNKHSINNKQTQTNKHIYQISQTNNHNKQTKNKQTNKQTHTHTHTHTQTNSQNRSRLTKIYSIRRKVSKTKNISQLCNFEINNFGIS